MTLTLSEKKVLTLLEQDARMPATKIAKLTNLSTEGVIKIIKRLEENKILQKFNLKINYSKMGYSLYPVHVKLIKMNPEIISRIKQTLVKYPSCTWYKFCEGEYDLLLSFKIKDSHGKKEMYSFLNEISDNILEKEISIVLFAFEVGKSFTEKKSNKIFYTFDYKLEKAVLKKDEEELIILLKKDSRESILSLSKKLNLSPQIVSKKIKDLQKENIISGFKVSINTSKLEYQPCFALITLSNYKEEEIKSLINYCQYTPGINYLVRQMGKYDLELTIDAQNINDFYEIIDSLRKKFPIISKISTLITKQNA
jgi:DNA-binding Lrp family transcriptional regulator